MGWKFWKPDKSEAEVSLERLQDGAELRQTPPGPSPQAASTQAASTQELQDSPTPMRAGDLTGFRMEVQDVFTITGRGTVVTGQVAAGVVSKHQQVTLTRLDGSSRTLTVTGIEVFRKLLDSAGAGENVGILLSHVTREEIARGDVLTG